MKKRRIITHHFLDVDRVTVMTQEVTHRASRQRTIPGSQRNIVETISGTFVPCTSHSGTIMADLLGSDDFREDPAAEFLAREQDDLAELGEDFGEEQPEANVSSSEPYF